MILKEFGPRLKSLRQSKRMNQQELSRLLGISRQAYSNYETGRCTPPVDVLAELTLLLDFNLFSMFLEAAIAKHSYYNSDLFQNNSNESEDSLCKQQILLEKF